MSRPHHAPVRWKLRLLLLLVLLPLFATRARAGEGPPSPPPATQDASTGDASSPAPPPYPLSTERKEKLAAYARLNNLWRFADFFIGLGVLAVVLFTGLSARLRDWAKRARRPFFVVWLYVVLLFAVTYLLSLPFHVYRGYVVESEFGFMNQGFFAWWGEDLLGLLVRMVVGVIPAWFLYWLVGRSRAWWAWFSAGSVPFLVLMMVVAPVLIAPLFNDFEPLQDPAIEERILALADRAGVEGADVFQVDASKQSNKVNAYVTGLFGSKRIVLYDTLLEHFEPEEIEFVMGHEIGHYVMHHVWLSLLLVVAFIALSLWLMNRSIHPVIARFHRRFGFDRLDDVASLPLVLMFLSVIGFLFQPVSNGLSRHFEHQADIYGMEITDVSGETAARAFDKLSALNLSDPDPGPLMEFWFYDHPSLARRMAFVRSYRRTGALLDH